MNYHPLLVHFPIAFMTVYCLLELIRVKKILAQDYWFYIKAILVLIGTASTVPTILAGKIIADQFESRLVEIHSGFALLTTLVFGIISISYLLAWIEKDARPSTEGGILWTKITKMNKAVQRQGSLVTFALLGLTLVSLTGGLGGIIAFGPDVDPLTKMINGLFFPR